MLLLPHLEGSNPGQANPRLSSWILSCIGEPPGLLEAAPYLHHLMEPTEIKSKTRKKKKMRWGAPTTPQLWL